MSSSFRMRVQQHQQIQVQLQKKPQKTKLRMCLQVRESTPVPFNYDYITFDTMHITGFLIKCLEDRKLSESEHLAGGYGSCAKHFNASRCSSE